MLPRAEWGVGSSVRNWVRGRTGGLEGGREHKVGPTAAARWARGSLQILLCCGLCPGHRGISTTPGPYPLDAAALLLPLPCCDNQGCLGGKVVPSFETTALKLIKSPGETGIIM